MTLFASHQGTKEVYNPFDNKSEVIMVGKGFLKNIDVQVSLKYCLKQDVELVSYVRCKIRVGGFQMVCDGRV